MIKKRTIEFANKVLSDPKMSHAQAYIETHETDHKPTAITNASKLLRSPEVILYMEEHRTLAARTQIEILQNARTRTDDLGWQKLASEQAEKVLDRTDGKPLTRTNNLNMNITIEEAVNSLI